MKLNKYGHRWLYQTVCIAAILLLTACQPIQPLPSSAPAPSQSPTEESTPSGTNRDVAGTYQGKLQIAGLDLEIIIKLQADGESYRGTIDIPQQGASDIPLHDINVEPPTLSFQMLEGAQLGTFKGEIAEDGTISGTFTQAGYDGTFALNAPETATEPLPAPSDASSAELYRDPQGLFTAPIPTNWTVSQEEGYARFNDPDQKINIYLLALSVESDDLHQAIQNAWSTVDPNFSLAESDSMEPPSSEGSEKNLVITYDSPSDRVVQAGAFLVKGTAYILLFDGDLTTTQRRAAQINIIQSGLDILSIEKTDLSNATPLPVDESITSQLETFINEWMAKFSIPGAAVAIVQNNKVVYSQGFGVRNEAGDPITPQTHMMIGSTGKSLTTLMMATLVDDGKMQWDTPAQQIYPQFAVKDPELSQTITMRNLVCACTGVPRRDLEFILNAKSLSAEDLVASLSDFEFFTDFGEAFQYSNQMVATGGYIAGVAASGEQTNLAANYVAALQARVLDPVGMNRTTLSFDEVKADGNYATPHGYNYQNQYEPISLDLEKVLIPVAPAGAHWSTLEDMSKYMIMQLQDGVNANGERIVSEENLNETRKPQIKVSDQTSYGLGWLIGDYKGQMMIDHGGNTLGFTSEFKFLPDAGDGGLGIIILTNAQGTNNFSIAVSERLLELVFQQETTVAASLDFVVQEIAKAGAKLQGQIGSTLDVSTVEPYLGDYQNDALGNMTLSLEDNTLHADFGEFASNLLPKNDEKGEFQGYMLIDPPLPGLLIKLQQKDGKPVAVMGSGVTEYTFEKSQ